MTQIERSERNRLILKLAREGQTADFIAQVVGMKRERVMMILRMYKTKAARKSHSLESVIARNIIVELEKGTKQCDIAKKFYVSRQYVNQVKSKWEIRNKQK